jgi:putative ABC transport system permease protein
MTAPQLTLTRSVVETRAHTVAPRLAWAGLGLVLLALLFLWLPSRSLVVAFAALFLALIGATLIAPLLVHWATRLPGATVSRWLGPTARLALRGIDAALSRTGVAIAALMLAVATTVGVGAMIASFRASVADWLATALRADFYVTAPSLKTSRTVPHLDPALVARLRTVSGVATFTSARRVVVESGAGLDELMALDIPPSIGQRLQLLRGEREPAMHAFFAGEAVLASEPYAWHRGIDVGARLRLRTDHGPREFTVAGVYRDYTSERGEILMIRSLYDRSFDDPYITTLGVWLAPGTDADTVAAQLRAQARPGDPMLLRSNREVREQSLAIFDRTFTITSVLRLLAVLAAVIGILSALTALALERAREFGVLRALGFTPGQVRALVMMQTGAMGLAAGVLALPVGTLLAGLLIHAINRRAFGWSMDMLVPAGVFGEALLLALGSALLAGLYPAWRLSRALPAESLREE